MNYLDQSRSATSITTGPNLLAGTMSKGIKWLTSQVPPLPNATLTAWCLTCRPDVNLEKKTRFDLAIQFNVLNLQATVPFICLLIAVSNL